MYVIFILQIQGLRKTPVYLHYTVIYIRWTLSTFIATVRKSLRVKATNRVIAWGYVWDRLCGELDGNGNGEEVPVETGDLNGDTITLIRGWLDSESGAFFKFEVGIELWLSDLQVVHASLGVCLVLFHSSY